MYRKRGTQAVEESKILNLSIDNLNPGSIVVQWFNNPAIRDKVRAKLSASLKGRVFSEEHKRNLRKPNRKSKVLSTEHKRKIGLASKGRHHTEEAKQKISLANKGRKRGPMSEEHKQKIRDTLRGRKRPLFSEEWKRNMSKAQMGKVLTEETKQKIRNWWERLKRYDIRRYLAFCRARRKAMLEYYKTHQHWKVKLNIEALRKEYDIPESMVFFPVSPFEHHFARALAESRLPNGTLYTQSGLKEHPFAYPRHPGEDFHMLPEPVARPIKAERPQTSKRARRGRMIRRIMLG